MLLLALIASASASQAVAKAGGGGAWAPAHVSRGGLRGGDSSSDASTSIVGGDEAEPGAYPWMVALLYGASAEGSNFNAYDLQACGGTLIDSEWVLTASHCVAEGAPDSVLVGAYDLIDWRSENYGFRVEHRQVLESVMHPDYDDWTLVHDVALLRIEPSTLPTLGVAAETPSVGADVTAIGWGDTTKSNKKEEYPSTLHDVHIDIVDCRDSIDDDHPSYLCASPRGSGEDACQGDSGGPLVAHLSGGDVELVGATSWGIGCNGGGVYADVADYRAFIEEHVGATTQDDGQGGGGGGDGSPCVDDDDFRFKGNSKKSCSWVASKSDVRCAKTDGGVLVSEHCPVTCDVCDDDEKDDAEAVCEDDPDWWFRTTSRTCKWVSKKPGPRCKKSQGGVSAQDACALTCGNCD